MKSILILGAYGLVGQHIVKGLYSRGNFDITKVKFDYLSDDIKDKEYDYIIHGAGYGQPQMFTKDKIATIGVNTTTTIELFKLLKDGGSFLYISTSEVYSGAPMPHTEEAIGTTSPQHPRACYIEGKRCGEAITMAYRDMGVDAKIARLSLAYGEGTKKGDTRVMNQLIEKALTLGRIELMDRGDAIRTYCYVEDAVGMMLDILFKGTQPVYNVGGKDTLTIGELAFRIGEITRTEVTLGDKSIRGSPDTVQLDMSRTLFEFPREFVPLEEGLKRTIEYQKRLYGK